MKKILLFTALSLTVVTSISIYFFFGFRFKFVVFFFPLHFHCPKTKAFPNKILAHGPKLIERFLCMSA